MKSADRLITLVRLVRELDRRARAYALTYPGVLPSETCGLVPFQRFKRLEHSELGGQTETPEDWSWIFYPLLGFLFENGLLWATLGHFHGPRDSRVRNWLYFLSQNVSGREDFRRTYAALSWYVQAAGRAVGTEHPGLPLVVTTALAEQIGHELARSSSAGKARTPYGAPLLAMLHRMSLLKPILEQSDAVVEANPDVNAILQRLDLRSTFSRASSFRDQQSLLEIERAVGPPGMTPSDALLRFVQLSPGMLRRYSESLQARGDDPVSAQLCSDSARHCLAVRNHLSTDATLLSGIAAYAAWISDFSPTAGAVLTINAYTLEEAHAGRSGALVLCFDRKSDLGLRDLHLVASAFRLGCVDMATGAAKHTGEIGGIREALDAFGHQTKKVLFGLTRWVQPARDVLLDSKEELKSPGILGCVRLFESCRLGVDDLGIAIDYKRLLKAATSLPLWAFVPDLTLPFDQEPQDFGVLVVECWKAALSVSAARYLYDHPKTVREYGVRGALEKFDTEWPYGSSPTVVQESASLSLGWDEFTRQSSLALARTLLCLFENCIEHGDGEPTVTLRFDSSQQKYEVEIVNNKRNCGDRGDVERDPRFSSRDVARFALTDIAGELSDPPAVDGKYAISFDFQYLFRSERGGV